MSDSSTRSVAEHTPGPWVYDYTMNGLDFVVGTTSADVVALVGSDEERGINGVMVEANARLIAAAPDLLAELQYAVDCHENHYVTDDAWLYRAEAAIAKAEGRS